MVQIGWVKFKKEEETVLTRSYILGLFLGLLFGIPLNYALGFPTMPKQITSSFLEQLVSLFLTLMSFEAFGWVSTILLALYLLKKNQRDISKTDVSRILSASIILFPVLLFYTALIYCAIVVPLNIFFAWLSFRTLYAIGALLFFPFVILFIAIIGPDSKPGKALRRFIHRF